MARRSLNERREARQAGVSRWGHPLPRAVGTNPRALRRLAEGEQSNGAAPRVARPASHAAGQDGARPQAPAPRTGDALSDDGSASRASGGTEAVDGDGLGGAAEGCGTAPSVMLFVAPQGARLAPAEGVTPGH